MEPSPRRDSSSYTPAFLRQQFSPTPPTSSVPASSKSALRARELYKYYRPITSTTNTFEAFHRSSAPDSILVTHAQLVAWRLDCQRALISLIDRDTQYIVAEGTRTRGDDDDDEEEPVYGNEEDAEWRCEGNGSQGPRTGRLYKHTVEMTGIDEGPSCFEVGDLAADERFRDLPFVKGEPGYRYYVGVPIRTKKGTAIGSVFAMDTRPREEGVSAGDLKFLKKMAGNVMRYLEMVKERQERKKVLRMNSGISAFVDPDKGGKRRRSSADGIRPERSSDGHRARPRALQRKHHSDEARSTRSEERMAVEEAPVPARVEDQDHLNTFQRAASLLYESLSLEEGGGVVFMDTSTPHMVTSRDQTSQTEDVTAGDIFRRRQSLSDLTRAAEQNASDKHAAGHTGHPTEQISSVVLGSRESPGDWCPKHRKPSRTFTPLSPPDIMKLIKRHPRGKLFVLDPDGYAGSSTSDTDTAIPSSFDIHQTKRDVPSPGEAELLSSHFPGARQVVFLPLWNSATSNWSSCFVYNTQDYYDISHNPDFLFCIAFCNCVMTEIGRLATLAADQQKSDFIGSISHELRSPLHGILASCEFMGDTECTSFQQSLVDTAASCARTLLDTINMVLDYSKMNAFEKSISKARRSRKALAAVAPGLQPLLNIYSDVDLAILTEEVVEGVSTGQIFKDITTFEAANTASKSDERRVAGPRKSDVEILIDIAPRKWTFVTQPGAFRRIIMNLYGNALKYTQRGHIRVKLEAENIEPKPQSANAQEEPSAIVTLTVTDTGQGISPEYMRTKLFTPFAQESSLNPGTGLGLSLVKGLVRTLNGDIHVKSTVGVGTEVTVRLPMMSELRSCTTTPSSGGSLADRVKDDSMTLVRERAPEMRAAMFWREHPDYTPEQREAAMSLRGLLSGCFVQWFGFQALSDWTPGVENDVVVVDEFDLPALLAVLRPDEHRHHHTIILVLCTNASRYASTKLYSHNNLLEFISLPVGPYKLARALRFAIDRLGQSVPASVHLTQNPLVPVNLPNPDLAPVVENMATQVEQITISTGDDEVPEISLLKQGQTLGNESSANAQMAMKSFQSPSKVDADGGKEEFPFPGSKPSLEERLASVLPKEDSQQLADLALSNSPMSPFDVLQHAPKLLSEEEMEARPSLAMTDSNTPTQIAPKLPVSSPPKKWPSVTAVAEAEEEQQQEGSPTPTAADALKTDPATAQPPPRSNPSPLPSLPPPAVAAAAAAAVTATNTPSRSPRLLLVDDNQINLRLLQTFMRKRRYSTFSLAEDGAQAVATFDRLARQGTPPDIVFMDISMPVLDGFEATRRIRAIEAGLLAAEQQQQQQQQQRSPSQAPAVVTSPCLIIALTGLAAGRDQSEAFVSGFDLYMTKPVSFREVGRLLDNWEANGGGRRGSAVPSGAVTAAGVGGAASPAAGAGEGGVR